MHFWCSFQGYVDVDGDTLCAHVSAVRRDCVSAARVNGTTALTRSNSRRYTDVQNQENISHLLDCRCWLTQSNSILFSASRLLPKARNSEFRLIQRAFLTLAAFVTPRRAIVTNDLALFAGQQQQQEEWQEWQKQQATCATPRPWLSGNCHISVK